MVMEFSDFCLVFGSWGTLCLEGWMRKFGCFWVLKAYSVLTSMKNQFGHIKDPRRPSAGTHCTDALGQGDGRLGE